MRGRPLVLMMTFALAGCNGDEPRVAGDTIPADTAIGGQQQVAVGVGTAADARTALLNAQGDTVGTAVLRETGEGVQIALSVRGLPPGEKGFHVHQVGRCDAPTFESAGPHFAPQGRQHGFENPAGPHAGDLRNVNVGSDGTAQQEFTAENLTLADGPNSLFDADGTSLVIHAQPDDYRTDPSGNSGDRIACGVITRGS